MFLFGSIMGFATSIHLFHFSVSLSYSQTHSHMPTQQTAALTFALDNGPLIVHSRVSKYRKIIRCIIFYNSNF